MAIPQVDRDALLDAIRRFDESARNSPEGEGWESNKAQVWALEHDGRLYPPKKIISMATGAAVSTFNGGPESNDYLQARGLSVRRLRDDTLKETLEAVLENYDTIRTTQSFGGHHQIRELFSQARRILSTWCENAGWDHLNVDASYGKGEWATIPWIALLDDRETRTAQEGLYIVILFCKGGRGVYLKLAEGVAKVERELGAGAIDVLARRAQDVRASCAQLAESGFDLSGRCDLGADQRKARLYDASTVAAKFYPRGNVPDDEDLRRDLQELVAAYQQYLTSRGAKYARDDRRLSLIGTWRDVVREYSVIQEFIRTRGAWASWWSFPIRDEAVARLKSPFYLYAYVGGRKLAARLRIDAMQPSKGQTGIVSPWPDVTRGEWIGKTTLGERQSEVCKTWFRVGEIELLDPPKSVDDFEPAVGLSNPDNLLNQSTFGYVIEEDLVQRGPELSPSPETTVPPAFDLGWLVQRTGLRREQLAEMVDALLGSSPQIMLAGPPGTSKTWVARQLALFVARGRSAQTRFVQFHPGYTYEAFIEGLRPVPRAAGVAFELTPGLVVETTREMHSVGHAGLNGCEYVVVMDEANRANLPRVLGELMFLFEYRNEPVRLQYSGEFSLPPNLRFIGTMNTADRSIRSIDIALRRRFDVFELAPDEAILASYYDKQAELRVPDLVDGFLDLNRALATNLDRHHTIGHAFFMRPLMDAAALQRIWQRKIFPLIEEFFFDQPELAKEFNLERFWRVAANGT